MTLDRSKILLIMFWFLLNQNLLGQTIRHSSYDRKIVIIPEGQSRTFMFTNRKGLFYYGETGLPNRSPNNGLSYLTYEFLEDYIVEIDGSQLFRSQAEVHLMGDRLIRHFENWSVDEEISMSDSLPVLTIKIGSKQKAPMSIAPLIAGSNQRRDFDVDWSSSDKVLFIAHKNHLVRDTQHNYPVWLGICTYPEGEFTTAGTEELAKKYNSKKQQIFFPGKINMFLESEAVILFIIGDNKRDLLRSRNLMLKGLNIEIKKNNSQIEGIRQAQSNSDPAFVLF